MDTHLYKSSGISLISGSLIIIVTMVLHPSGGSLEQIIKISKLITITHTLAIVCLPFILFGFYGLSKKLKDKWKLSVLALIIILFGLVAAMFAALVNGLTLPYFLKQYTTRLEETSAVLRPIVNYSFALNTPLDYIFITACCLSISIYSIVILRSNTFPKWIGYLGLFIMGLSLLGIFSNFVFTSLTGFRIFTFSLAGWLLASGISLIKSR